MLAPSTSFLQLAPGHSQKMPPEIPNAAEQRAVILREPGSTSRPGVSAGSTWEQREQQDEHSQERSDRAAAFGQHLLKHENFSEVYRSFQQKEST